MNWKYSKAGTFIPRSQSKIEGMKRLNKPNWSTILKVPLLICSLFRIFVGFLSAIQSCSFERGDWKSCCCTWEITRRTNLVPFSIVHQQFRVAFECLAVSTSPCEDDKSSPKISTGQVGPVKVSRQKDQSVRRAGSELQTDAVPVGGIHPRCHGNRFELTNDAATAR